MPYKVLIVEDELAILEVVKMNLEMEGYEVVGEGMGNKALDWVGSENFNLIILDVMLPDVDGFTICQRIRLHDKDTPILFLTARDASQDKVEGLKLGGDDYMTKPFNLDEFLLRVKVLLKHSLKGNAKEYNSNVYSFGANCINFDTFSAVTFTGEKIKLTKKEANLLRLLINRKGEVISRSTILSIVWDFENHNNTRTIDNFINRFRRYFERDPKKPVHFFSERKMGYKFIDS